MKTMEEAAETSRRIHMALSEAGYGYLMDGAQQAQRMGPDGPLNVIGLPTARIVTRDEALHFYRAVMVGNGRVPGGEEAFQAWCDYHAKINGGQRFPFEVLDDLGLA